MVLLGIETSGMEGAIAIIRDSACLGEVSLNQAGRRHAQSLVLEIRDLIRAHGMTPRNIDAVAISRGPGSFTGLRVGMVCAKTFCYATGCRMIAVDTFEAIANQLPEHSDRVWVVEDAQRADLFVGEYRRTPNGVWKLQSPIQIVSVTDFVASRGGADLIAGPGLRKLNSVEHSLKTLDDIRIARPRAATVARLGLNGLNSGQFDDEMTDFWKAAPFYLRLSAAEEKRLATT